MAEAIVPRSRPTGLPVTVLFVALVLAAGWAIGFFTGPDDWYAGLRKPSFNPPSWVFAPVWTTLYVMIGMAGARTWTANRRSIGMRLWWAQLLLNLAWSPIFFRAHSAEAALVDIAVLWLAIVGYILATSRRDRTAAALFAPYALWVSFAALLNATIVILN